MAKNGKNGVYGIGEFAIADPAANGAYPTSFPFKFKAIVSGSLMTAHHPPMTWRLRIRKTHMQSFLHQRQQKALLYRLTTCHLRHSKRFLAILPPTINGITSNQLRQNVTKLYKSRPRRSTIFRQRCFSGQR